MHTPQFSRALLLGLTALLALAPQQARADASDAVTAPPPVTSPAEVEAEPAGSATRTQAAPSAEEAPGTGTAPGALLADVDDFAMLDLDALLNASVQTASRRAEPISRAPAIIEVLTRDDLHRLGVTNLYQALTYLPGVELIESYFGYTTLIFRGMAQEIYNAKVLMLINGHPSYEPVNSSFYMELIPLDAIERIEVIRGPGSVLYGTNAFAGVINVITREALEDGQTTVARAQGGSFGTATLGGGNFGRSGDLAWGIFASGFHSSGYSYIVEQAQNEDCTLEAPLVPAHCTGPGPSAEFDYFDKYVNTYGDLQYKGVRLQLGAMTQEKQKYGAVPVVRFHGPNEFQRLFADLSYRYDWKRFSLGFRLGVDRDKREHGFGRFPFPRFLESSALTENTMQRGEIMSRWSPLDNFHLDQGISYELNTAPYYDLIQSDGSLHALSPRFDGETPNQNSLAFYNQITWSPHRTFTLLAGSRVTRFQTDYNAVRLDAQGVPRYSISRADPVINHSPRGGVVYAPKDNLAFKLLYGEAFRAPNLFETVAVLSQIVGVTPNVQPETIRTLEFGVDSRPLPWLSLRSNLYYSLLSDLIGRRPPTPDEVPLFGAAAGIYDNLPGQEIFGIETAVRAIINEHWTFFANATAKQVRERESGANIRASSPFSANGGLSYEALDWLIIRPNAQYFGPRAAARAYTLLNAVVDFPLSNAFTVSLIGQNLLNTRYDYPEFVRQVVPTIPGGPPIAGYVRLLAEF
jgi:outer membrane receptor for ferrienterochelin and colicins